MKQHILINQLKALPIDKLFNYANKLHIATEDKDTDERSIDEFCRFLKTQSSIGRMISILEFPNMNYDKEYKTWMVDFGDKKEGFEEKELIDALFKAVIATL